MYHRSLIAAIVLLAPTIINGSCQEPRGFAFPRPPCFNTPQTFRIGGQEVILYAIKPGPIPQDELRKIILQRSFTPSPQRGATLSPKESSTAECRHPRERKVETESKSPITKPNNPIDEQRARTKIFLENGRKKIYGT